MQGYTQQMISSPLSILVHQQALISPLLLANELKIIIIALIYMWMI
jgi:hypothetical protein